MRYLALIVSTFLFLVLPSLLLFLLFFFLNDTPPPEISPLPLYAALAISPPAGRLLRVALPQLRPVLAVAVGTAAALSLGEFGASLLLMVPRTMGLSVWVARHGGPARDRKSTRLNSSHDQISYAVFCVKKKKKTKHPGLPLPFPHTIILYAYTAAAQFAADDTA